MFQITEIIPNCYGLFTSRDSDSDPDSNPIPVVGS